MMAPDDLIRDDLAADDLSVADAHLAGPLAAGHVLRRLALVADGAKAVATLPEPLAADTGVFAVLKRDLGEAALVIDAVTGTEGAPGVARRIAFAPWSERGARLPLRVPRDGAAAGPVAIVLDAAGMPLVDDVEIAILGGIFGNLASLLDAETGRLRRTIRRIGRLRLLEAAEGVLLDRLGAEVGVPRFDHRIRFAAGAMLVDPESESDPSYRRRLAPYRQWAAGTRRELLDALATTGVVDGAGQPAFDLLERDNPFDLTLRVVSVAPTAAAAQAAREGALDRLRRRAMLDPGDAAPPGRLVSSAVAATDAALHADLRAAFGAPAAHTPIAFPLARALLRLRRTLESLGIAGAFTIAKGQADDGGSRHELGLAVALDVPAGLEATLRAAIGAADGDDPLVAQMKAQEAAQAAGLDWFFEPLGFPVHIALSPTQLYLSHLRIGRLAIRGPAPDSGMIAAPADAIPFEIADLVAPEATRLAEILSVTAADAGFAPIAAVADPLAAIAGGLDAPQEPLAGILASDRLGPVVPADAAARIAALPPPGLAAIRIGGADAQTIRQGEAAAIDRLRAIAFDAAAQGVPSFAVLLPAGGDVLLAASATGLPGLGANLTSRQAVLHRWWVVPLVEGSAEAQISATGTRALFVPRGAGVWCLVAQTYRREGATHPFEIGPVLPPGTTMGFDEYERVMNLLLRYRPAGVEVNTWMLRRRHVTLDPAAPPGLDLAASRSFRRDRRPRFAAPPSSTGE